jgi:hypothetical protein
VAENEERATNFASDQGMIVSTVEEEVGTPKLRRPKAAGTFWGTYSVVLGVIAMAFDAHVFGPAFSFFTPVFALAGFVVGILVTVLPGKTSLGCLGIILSVLATVFWFAGVMAGRH